MRVIDLFDSSYNVKDHATTTTVQPPSSCLYHFLSFVIKGEEEGESGGADEGGTQDTSIQAAASTAPAKDPQPESAAASKGFAAGIKGLANGAAAVTSNVGAAVTSTKVGVVNVKPASGATKKNNLSPTTDNVDQTDRNVIPVTPKFKVFNDKVIERTVKKPL